MTFETQGAERASGIVGVMVAFGVEQAWGAGDPSAPLHAMWEVATRNDRPCTLPQLPTLESGRTKAFVRPIHA